ncbi:helix-turn-helix transcriptional regulator [Paenibacillus tritici]|uniref:helix-turn-helix transcriptional regulator n=1 Tax=Paenibacillus tritici TaxID=1873425 RepID=UPI001BA79B29|nr:helix-turn-helix transcriptional regulator [Paenibacillus tritici]QUL56477.1 helix-turn-helix transcriptional regulator [Paenibacillus tritici]
MNFSAIHPYVYLATRYPFASGQSSSPRICYMSSVYLIGGGYGTLLTGGQTLRVGPGMLIHLPPGQLHEWRADDEHPMVHLCCYFDWQHVDREGCFDWACPICYKPEELQEEMLGPLFPYPLPQVTDAGLLRGWTERFQKFYKAGEFDHAQTFFRNLTIQRNFQEFIEDLLHLLLKDQRIPDRRISGLLEQLEQDLLHDVPKPLETYYSRLQLSRGHFFELFRRSTGVSPVEYMNRFRINRAREDLLHSPLSITAIAAKYHFSSLHYFSRLFHRQTGQTPREFRQLRR